MSEPMLDRAGRRRSPATLPGFHIGQVPGNKGHRYPADPPKVEEIIAVMRAAGDRPHGRRLRALIVNLWRADLRINEALALAEGDLDPGRGSLLVRRGKGGRRREVGMDAGPGSNCSHGSSSDASYPSGRCCASSPARAEAVTGRRPPCAPNSAESPRRPGFVAGSRRTSCAMPTRSRWLAKACR